MNIGDLNRVVAAPETVAIGRIGLVEVHTIMHPKRQGAGLIDVLHEQSE